MRKVDVHMAVKVKDRASVGEIVRRMKLEGLRAGAEEIGAWMKEPAEAAMATKVRR